jgi:hypothetical protein
VGLSPHVTCVDESFDPTPFTEVENQWSLGKGRPNALQKPSGSELILSRMKNWQKQTKGEVVKLSLTVSEPVKCRSMCGVCIMRVSSIGFCSAADIEW